MKVSGKSYEGKELTSNSNKFTRRMKSCIKKEKVHIVKFYDFVVYKPNGEEYEQSIKEFTVNFYCIE